MQSTSLQKADMYIGGEWVPANAGRRFQSKNPATLDPLAEVADGGRDETNAAITAAHEAFPAWSETPAQQRAKLLLKAAESMTARREELATILTKENGKPLTDARSEIDQAISFFVWNAEEARRIHGSVIPPATASHRVLIFRQPVGVVAAIVPWNFPASMVTRKIGPALAAGCTAVLRPARATSLITVEMFKSLALTGFPKGVVNLVTGADSASMGVSLTTNPLVRKLTFTGSTEIGKRLLALTAGTVKRVSLELGGHAPFIVFDDADLDRAASAAVSSRFRNCGQTCISTNRVLVQRSVAEAFTERMAANVRKLRVGNGLDPGVDLGPLIDKNGFDKVIMHVEDALSKGATALVGGHPARVDETLKGYFYEPTLLAGATTEMVIMHEETFGPVLPLMVFDTEEEAIRIANDTTYGLAAYFFSRDVGRVLRVAERLEYGMVGANEPRPFGPHIPFGGVKESGMGRENGAEGIGAFLETKAVVIGF
jgi:succinate-semialdehyde dehydrogenase / glutarate-semialdehyde dehydrogenase